MAAIPLTGTAKIREDAEKHGFDDIIDAEYKIIKEPKLLLETEEREDE